MAERRPDPQDLRASLVDSGWSEPEPQPERILPKYEDVPREHLVTRVDDQIQSRVAAMQQSESELLGPESERTLVADDFDAAAREAEFARVSQERTAVNQMSPFHEPAAPPAKLPKPPVAPAHRPVGSFSPVAAVPSSAPRSTLPPPPPPSSPPPPPRRSSVPPRPPAPPSAAAAGVTAAPAVPHLPAVPHVPANLGTSPAFAVPPVPPPPLPPSFPPPAPLAAPVAPFSPPRSFGAALVEPVSVAGGKLPLWLVLLPFVAGSCLLAGLVGGLIGSMSPEPTAPAAPAALQASSEVAPPVSESRASPTLPNQVQEPSGVVERAARGELAALKTLEQKSPPELRTEEALALSAGRSALAHSEGQKLRERLASDPGLAKDPKIVSELLRLSRSPEASREALAAMAALPGPLSADLLYEVWTGTPERSGATELAQTLILSRDVRAKASPALRVALDLRMAQSCEQNAKLLERALEVGDKRSFGPLSRLLRRTGCGPGKKQDCHACLRGNEELLRKAIQTAKLRREPDFLPP